jgi:hypothetical protein
MQATPETHAKTHSRAVMGNKVPSLPSRDGTRFLLVLVPAAVLFTLAAVFAANRSVWGDEAMYLVNLRQHWDAFLSPLPLYDQGSPPLVSVLFSLVLPLGNGDPFALRIAILVAFLTSLCFFGWQLARAYQAPLLALVTVLTLLSNGIVVRYVTEIKQYGVEGIVSLILLALYFRALRRDIKVTPRAAYGLLLAGVALSFLSYAVLIVATTVLLDRAVFSEDRTSKRAWWVSLLAFWGLYGLLYLFLYKPLVSFALNNYWLEYEPYLLRDHFLSVDFWKHLLQIVLELFRPTYVFALVPLAFLVVVALGRRVWRNDSFAPARLVFLLSAAILFLSALGVYPLFRSRHLFYTLPFVALMVGWAAQELINRFPRRSFLGACLVAAFLLPAGLLNAYFGYSGRYDFQRTRELVAFLSGEPDKYVLLYAGIQPPFDFYSEIGAARAGRQTVLGRVNRETGAPRTPEETIANYPSVVSQAGGWATTINLWILKRLDIYTDWMVSQVPADESALLAMGHYDPHEEELIAQSLAKRNCVSAVVFEDRGVKALRIACPSVP